MDARKKAILAEKFIAYAPVCPVVCGYVQFSKLRKGFAPGTLKEIFRCAQSASYLSTITEAYCTLEDFIEEVARWKDVTMFGETATVLVETLIELLKKCKYEVIIFDDSTKTS